MKGSRLYLLGFLGFVGLLGLVVDNPGFYGFFGFFGFFAYKRIIPDERFMSNAAKAGRNAFFVSMILFPLVSTVFAYLKDFRVYGVAYALNFGMQVLVFSLSLTWYENRGV